MKKKWTPIVQIVLAIVALGISSAAIFVILSAKSGTPSNTGSGRPAAISSVTPMAVYQPPSARQVADSLDCKKFKDHGPSEIGGSIDSGVCWIGNVKYAINTFPSLAVRDTWLESAEPLGVVPKWETDTSVTYKSVA